MEIIEYEPAFAVGVAACFNRLTDGLPHCFPAAAERVGAIMEARDPGRQELKSLHDDHAWVARDGAEVIGFAQAALEEPDERRETPRGLIRFLAYDAGRRRAGQALLSRVEAFLREREMPDVVAFHQDYMWPCYHFPHAYLSDRVSHVHAVLGAAGYERAAGEVYWEWRDLEPPEIPPTEVSVELRAEPHSHEMRHPSFCVKAFQGDEHIAECWCASCGVAAPRTEAEEWCLTTWLGVNRRWRRHRLGAHVLATALHKMREFGFRHAAISTSWSNFRAQLFYANFGYRTSDWTYALAKSFDE